MWKRSHSSPNFNPQGRSRAYVPNKFHIDRMPAGCSIQVNDMQPACTSLLPALCDSHRVGIVGRNLAIVPLVEPHTLLIFDIDRWQDNHCTTHFTKFFNSCKPAAPLFSG